MRYTTLFFDLDDTVYPNSTGLWDAIKQRMSMYMLEKLGLPKDQIPILRRQYFTTYGTTLRGLQKHHQVDADEYLAYVHDLPLEKYLTPSAEIRKMMLSLPQKKYIFTNADADHARRVLKRLQLSDCFESIIDLRAMQFACKPEAEAYKIALRIAGNPDPQQCVLLDDMPANLIGASQLGFTTVLVGSDGSEVNDPVTLQSLPNDHLKKINVVIPDLTALPKNMPELWEHAP